MCHEGFIINFWTIIHFNMQKIIKYKLKFLFLLKMLSIDEFNN